MPRPQSVFMKNEWVSLHFAISLVLNHCNLAMKQRSDSGSGSGSGWGWAYAGGVWAGRVSLCFYNNNADAAIAVTWPTAKRPTRVLLIYIYIVLHIMISLCREHCSSFCLPPAACCSFFLWLLGLTIFHLIERSFCAYLQCNLVAIIVQLALLCLPPLNHCRSHPPTTCLRHHLARCLRRAAL